MSQPNQLPTAIRNIRARLRPLKRPLAWGSLGFVFLLTMFVWEYWHDREPIDFETLFPDGDSLLFGDARETAAEIDSSWAIEEDLKVTRANSSETNPENSQEMKADRSGTNWENLPKQTERLGNQEASGVQPKQANPNAPAGRATTNPKLTPEIGPEIDSFTLKIPEVEATSRQSPGAKELANPLNFGSASARGNVSESGMPANGAPNFWTPEPLLPRSLQQKASQVSPLQAAVQQYPPLAIRPNYSNRGAIAPGNSGNPGNSGFGYPGAIAPRLGNTGNSGFGYPGAIAPGNPGNSAIGYPGAIAPGNPGNSAIGYPGAIAPGLSNTGNSAIGYPGAIAPGLGNTGNSAIGYGSPSINAIGQPNQLPNAEANANELEAFPTASGQNPYDLIYSRPSRSGSGGQPGYPATVDNSAIEVAPGVFYSPLPERLPDGSALPRQIPLPAASNGGAYASPEAANIVTPSRPSNSYNYLLQYPEAIGNNAPPVRTTAPTTAPEAQRADAARTNFGAVNPALPNQRNLVNQTRPAAIPQTQPTLANPNQQNGLPGTQFNSEFQNPQLQPVAPRAPFTVPRPIPGRYIGGGEINTFSNP